MGHSDLLVLALVLNVAQSLEILGVDEEKSPVITHNVTAVLGEDVYLRCEYVGKDKILSAMWKRQISSKIKSKPLAGFTDDKPFSRPSGFSKPDSATNLTVKMNVSGVDVEGRYICEFESEEASYTDSLFLTVMARPEIQTQVTAETINDTHYQSVLCSASGGRPLPEISWLVGGLPPSEPYFFIDMNKTAHSNGTFTLSSTLHFPTHLQDKDSVVCIVQHPALPTPKLNTAVRVETYMRPNVTIKAEMVQRGGSDFWVVSCMSSGGRPDTEVSLALNGEEELQREDVAGVDTQTSSVLFPVEEYQGHNVTCVFDHPKFTHSESRFTILPTFNISGVKLLSSELQSNKDVLEGIESVELQEGQTDVVISLQVDGNVPRYNVTCKKDDGPLPEGVAIVGSNLTVQGPLEHGHAGLYECFFSYHHLQASLKFNVTARLQVIEPAIGVDVQTKDGRLLIECSAADAVPAANMSWLLPEGVSGVSWFNFTSHNGSHSVRGVLLLPACSPRELSAECVINHPAFEKPQNRSITLPLCARPNITVSSSIEWKDGDKYMKVDCSVDSEATAASITWHVEDTGSSISPLSKTEVQSGSLVSSRSSVYFLSSLYSGHNLTCMVEHLSLKAAERRTIHIPVHKAPQLSVSVVRQQDSPLWLAVCDCTGEGVGSNLEWVLPESAKEHTSLHLESEGLILKARLTCQFSLALHEGQNLTCVYHFKHGVTEKRTMYIPRYYISSLRVLNHTTALKSHHGGEPVMHRLSLQENQHNQRVLLQVKGNVPEYDLDCERSDGSFVQMDQNAVVFPSELTVRDEGLYTCRASFYHHTAIVVFEVEVMSQDKLFNLATLICVSSASVFLLILLVTLCVCCKIKKPQQKKRESLSALTTLMQEPISPGAKKHPVKEKDGKDYSQVISYSIVIDVKSNV